MFDGLSPELFSEHHSSAFVAAAICQHTKHVVKPFNPPFSCSPTDAFLWVKTMTGCGRCVQEVALARGKTALVTGAAGFIGSHVARPDTDLGCTWMSQSRIEPCIIDWPSMSARSFLRAKQFSTGEQPPAMGFVEGQWGKIPTLQKDDKNVGPLPWAVFEAPGHFRCERRHCSDLGMRVLALDDLSGGFRATVPEGVTFIQGRQQHRCPDAEGGLWSLVRLVCVRPDAGNCGR